MRVHPLTPLWPCASAPLQLPAIHVRPLKAASHARPPPPPLLSSFHLAPAPPAAYSLPPTPFTVPFSSPAPAAPAVSTAAEPSGVTTTKSLAMTRARRLESWPTAHVHAHRHGLAVLCSANAHVSTGASTHSAAPVVTAAVTPCSSHTMQLLCPPSSLYAALTYAGPPYTSFLKRAAQSEWSQPALQQHHLQQGLQQRLQVFTQCKHKHTNNL